MRKAYAVLFGMFMFVACSDDNPTSGLDNTQTTVPSAHSNVDFGEGYTFVTPFRFEEDTKKAYVGTCSCNYHPDTKTFAWEENLKSLEPSSFRVVGDSLWIGPTEKQVSEDPNEQQFLDAYRNVETLSLSNSHNGIYGVWELTGCERILGETEIKCSKFIAHLSGITRTFTITPDSLYITTRVSIDNAIELGANYDHILDDNLGFDIGDLYIDSLFKTQVIKEISHQAPNPVERFSFSIGNQVFEVDGYAKFDSTGMNYFETFSSNGKTCTRHERFGNINEKMCKDESAEFLLSDRDKSEEQFYYEEGSVEGFKIDNRDEYYECTKSLVTEETKNLLSPFAKVHNN